MPDQAAPAAQAPALGAMERIKEIRSKHAKIRYDLIPPIPLYELGYVYTAGAVKYSENGWIEKPMPFHELFGRIFRHVERIRMGEMFDEDDGQMHGASIAWAGLALCQYQVLNIGVDNRKLYLPAHMEISKP